MSLTNYTFIVNPEAGRGSSLQFLAAIESELRTLGESYKVLLTEFPRHATQLAAAEKNNGTVVVAIGGDGTAHEVASGLDEGSSFFSALPAGSGNDFARMLGYGGSPAESFRLLKSGVDTFCDVGHYQIESLNGGRHDGVFINSLGIGLDASISYASRSIKNLKGVPLYLVATIRTLRTFQALPLRVRMAGREWEKSFFLVCVGNGHQEGGGFSMTPNARPSDGKFEVCLIEDMPLYNSLRLIPRVLRGSHEAFKGVQLIETQEISVGSKIPFCVHCDGEIPATDAVQITVDLKPGALRVRAARNSYFTDTLPKK